MSEEATKLRRLALLWGLFSRKLEGYRAAIVAGEGGKGKFGCCMALYYKPETEQISVESFVSPLASPRVTPADLRAAIDVLGDEALGGPSDDEDDRFLFVGDPADRYALSHQVLSQAADLVSNPDLPVAFVAHTWVRPGVASLDFCYPTGARRSALWVLLRRSEPLGSIGLL